MASAPRRKARPAPALSMFIWTSFDFIVWPSASASLSTTAFGVPFGTIDAVERADHEVDAVIPEGRKIIVERRRALSATASIRTFLAASRLL